MARRSKRILVVCHGNVYRSPLAAAVLSKTNKLEVKSAGLKSKGKLAARPIRDVAERMGLPLNGHRARQLSPTLLTWADMVVVMNKSQRLRVMDFAARSNVKQNNIRLLGYYANPARESVPDPAFYKATSPRFREIVEMVVQAAEQLREVLTR